MAAETSFMDKLTALCKRRGFIFQSSEIYGGIGGFWDYGPLGVELKRNIKNQWWHDYVTNPPAGPDGREIQMVGLDCSIIMNPKVWEASGHASGFSDQMRECPKCKRRFRDDKLWTVGFYAMDVIFPKLIEIGSQLGLIEKKPSEIRSLVRSDPVVRSALFGAFQPKIKKTVEADSYDDAIARVEQFPLSKNERKLFPDDNYLLHAIPLSIAAAVDQACPDCGAILSEARQFNLMFKTNVGAVEDPANSAYLRPETAQGIFANYKNVLDTSRVKIPFGIAQIGKAFRNEINPRNYTFRSREFEQMEIEFFCRDEDSMKWYEFWRNHRFNWYVNLGLKSEKLRLRDQDEKELAHYSKACADIEYLFPFSDEHQELEGCAHRGCFDLNAHQTASGVDLNYFEEEAWAKFLADRKARGEPELTKDQKGELGSKPPYRYLPTVIEPSAGADRATLAFLCEAYTEDQKPDAKGVMQTRVYMRFHPKLAPIKAAFLPLVNKEGMPEVAEKLYREAKKHFNVYFDDGGAIGRRYYRQDEAGTPFCITVDGDTIKGDGENTGKVTIRDRDTLEQVRVGKEHIIAWLKERLGAGQ